MIIVNLKNYKIGKDVADLMKKIEIYYNKAIVAVPFIEMNEIVKNTSLQIYSQHVSYYEGGRGTGHVMPESLMNIGVNGSILNHSEHKISLRDLKKTIKRCNELDFKLVVCANTLKEVSQIVKLKPFAIAFEDPKLIATGKSITSAESNEIKKFVGMLENTEIIPLCGAGISSGDDVAAALVLGCKGVLVASAVASSQNPEKFLKEISSLI